MTLEPLTVSSCFAWLAPPSRRRLVAPLGLAALATMGGASLGGCGDLQFDGFLNIPMGTVVRDGLPLVQLSFADEGTSHTAPVATLSPQSVVDGGGRGSRLTGDLRLLDGIQPNITRFIFYDVDVIDSPLGQVGIEDAAVALGGMLGADLLSQFAVHLTYPAVEAPDAPVTGRGELTLKDEIPDTSDQLAEDCDVSRLLIPGGFDEQRCLAVFSTIRRGGGLMLAGDEEVFFAATRLVVPVCLIPDDFVITEDQPASPPTETTGQAATAALATDLGISIISRTAFDRLRLRFPDLTEETDKTLHLPTGPESVSVTKIPRIAVVSNETSDLGPCGELSRRRRLLLASSQGLVDPADEREDGAAATVIRTPVPFAVLSDLSPLWQGLRVELGSQTAEVDVLLGGSFLRFLEIDLDYPERRTIAQCAHSASGMCQGIPRCVEGGTPPCPNANTP